MSATRRQFLRAGALSGAALVLRIPLFAEQARQGTGRFAPNQWLRIGADGKVTAVVARSEMGQGVRTALAMILAEELDADWKAIVVEQAVPGPDYPRMSTGGSGSVEGSWKGLRQAGAAAREMLVEAAARRWNMPASSCRAEAGTVVHAASSRRLSYGELASEAAALPVPKEPRLKDPKDFRLVGTRVRRVDGPAIVSGSAAYGIDTRIPGMLFAAVASSPVRGAELLRYEVSKAKAVPGVRDVVPIDGAVAVLADDTFAALAGRDALGAVWNEGPNGALTTADLWSRIDAAAEEPGRVSRQSGDAGTALAAAATRLSATYRTPFQAHATLEPGNCTAKVEAGACEIWAPTQNPQRVQREAAKLLGIAPEKVTVHVTLIGGGFGRRLDADYALEAVAVARAAKRPGAGGLVALRRLPARPRPSGRPRGSCRGPGLVGPTRRLVAPRHDVSPVHVRGVQRRRGSRGQPVGRLRQSVRHRPPRGVVERDRVAREHRGVASGLLPGQRVRARVLPRRDRGAGGQGSPGAAARASGRAVAGRGRQAALRPGGPLARAADRRREGRLERRPSRGAPAVAPAAASPATSTTGARSSRRSPTSRSAPGAICAVHRIVTAVDCGQAVNLLGVEGQVESGVIWGLSYALKGELTYARGRVAQTGFADYPVLRLDEMPSLETHVLPGSGAPTGMGEMPVPAVAPAVANAIRAATGKGVRRLPIRADDLRA